MSIRFLLLALVAFGVLCNARVISNTSRRSVTDITGRIIGGTEADPGQFPYQVSLRDDYGHFCGGSIISNRWTMTAEHCVFDVEFFNGVFRIVTGAHHSVIGGTEYVVDRVVHHPEYNSETLENDIALVRTDREIVFSNLVAAIPFSNAHVGAGVTSRTSGWGSTVVSVVKTFSKDFVAFTMPF